MKKLLPILLLIFFAQSLVAQTDSVQAKREYVAYTVFYNVVPDNWNYPLVGFINVAKGNHRTLQAGFVNTTVKNFVGLQLGFVNTVGGENVGLQMGFVNTQLKNNVGIRLGFVNTTVRENVGLDIGFVNTALKNNAGLNIGFVNTTLKENLGLNIGFVNTVLKNNIGVQVGFVNVTRKSMAGLQIGFVNYADTIVGLPVGFLSIVRRGGYRALELSANELYPVNLAFKIGVKKFYTFFQASYNNSYEKNFGLGFGAGSLIDLGKNFYFNPEISTVSAINNNINTTIFAPNFRYQFGKSRFQIFAAPSFVWLNYEQDKNFYEKPFFSLINTEINNRNSLLIGARAGVSVDL